MLVYKWLLNSVAVFSPPDEGKPGAADPPAGDKTPAAGDGQGEAGGAEGGEGAGDGGEGSGDGKEGDGAGAEGEGEAGDGKPPAPATKAAPDWKDKELNRKHRQLQDEKRARQAAEQELADARALLARAPKKEGEAAPEPPARTFTKDDVDRAAAAQNAVTTYNQQCDDAFNKGKAEYKDDWDKALGQLKMLGGLGDGEQGVEVMQGILATDDPAKVLHTLGSNPDEYHRVMELPPSRRLAEMVKLGLPDKKPPVKKPSALDPPVNGIQRRANADDSGAKLYDDKTQDGDWYAIRTAQKARNFAKTGNPFKSA